jgi:hypothetical protein
MEPPRPSLRDERHRLRRRLRQVGKRQPEATGEHIQRRRRRSLHRDARSHGATMCRGGGRASLVDFRRDRIVAVERWSGAAAERRRRDGRRADRTLESSHHADIGRVHPLKSSDHAITGGERTLASRHHMNIGRVRALESSRQANIARVLMLQSSHHVNIGGVPMLTSSHHANSRTCSDVEVISPRQHRRCSDVEVVSPCQHSACSLVDVGWPG